MKQAKNESVMSTEERLAVIENTMQHITATLVDIKQDMNRGLDRIDTKISAMDQKFETKLEAIDHKFECKFTANEDRFSRLENRMWSNFLWLMGGMFGLAGLIAHAHHWV